MITIGVWIIGIFLALFFFKIATRKKENIILKPLDMEKSQLNLKLIDELEKCIEEDEEFINGSLNGDVDNTIEEFWDSIQTKLNAMSIMGIDTEDIYDGLYKHIKKMYVRGYVFKE